MNEYENLYLVKQDIEKQISKNKLFKLSIQDAILIVLEKVGVLYSLSRGVSKERQYEFLKKLCKTNASEVDEIPFIQESVKWVFRWCAKYCSEKSQVDKKDLVAQDIYDLMGVAYSYEKFSDVWELHSEKKTRYAQKGNKIIFDYYCEDIYKTHLFYDTFFRICNNEKMLEKVSAENIYLESLVKSMNYAHQLDFKCSFNIEFTEFNLKDYRKFSTALTQLFTQNMLGNMSGNSYIINPEDEGVLAFTRDGWIEKLSSMTGINCEKVEKIIEFFTYDFNDSKCDISLSYFVPLDENYLVVSDPIFNLSRPETNAMRLLAKKSSPTYDFAQNNFEDEERKKVESGINSKYLTGHGVDKSLKNIPGFDLLVYDPETNNLQIIELKYKIPVESTRDIIRLDKLLEKGYDQIEEAKKYSEDNITLILEIYFGEKYRGIVPSKIDYFVLTNDSIGTGINTNIPTPIILIDHFIELMEQSDGMERVRHIIKDPNKKLPIEQKKRYSRYSLLGYKILIPEYSFRFLLNN